MFREILKTLRNIFANPAGRLLVVGLASMLAFGTVFYHFVENWSWIDSLYFTVITLTTVGYGDLAPTTPVSKVVTIVFVLVGVGAVLGFLDFLVRRTYKRRGRELGFDDDPTLD